MAERQVTAILTSHSLRELEDFCDSYVLLDNKTVSSSGDIAEKINSFCKFQLAFCEEISEGLFAKLPVLRELFVKMAICVIEVK